MLEQIASQAFTLLAGRTLSLKSGSPLDALESFKVAINVYGMALQTPCFMAVLDWRSALVCALAIFTYGTTIERKYTIKMRKEPFIRTFIHIYTNIGSKRPRTPMGSENLCIFVQFPLQVSHLSKKLGRNAQM
jgi:hypothetical protein